MTQILELAGSLNINRPNTLIKMQRLPDWIKKQDPTKCC